MTIALWGDLKYGRTTHSLIFALAKFGATILFCPSPGLEVPDNIMHKLVTEYGANWRNSVKATRRIKKRGFPCGCCLYYPGAAAPADNDAGIDLEVTMKAGVDALYVTRPQRERFTSEEKAADLQSPSSTRN